MLKQQNYIQSTLEEFSQINSVKRMIEQVYNEGSFFQLSLKTLELIRRFNNLFINVIEGEDDSPTHFNQLVITSETLERELIQGT